MDYYSWGPKTISMVVEPQGVLTCWSSSLAVLADSGPFLGLLLMFWCPGVISMIDEPQGAFTCWSSTLAVFLDSYPFHGLLLNFGVSKRFPWLSNPKVCLRVGHQDSHFGPILARFLDYYSVLGSPSDFHD